MNKLSRIATQATQPVQPTQGIEALPRTVLLGLVRAYRYFVSPWLGRRCRFYPTCSAYALEALQQHGAWRGGWLSARRVCRCHPLHPGGVDPVPPR